MTKKIFCKHCGASRASLEPIIENLEDGTTLQTVRCIMCGERRSRVVHNYRELPKQGRVVAPPRTRKPCVVEGCDGWVSPQNKSGFCNLCGNRMRQWQKRGGKTPPPFIQVAGEWIINPARKEETACA
jgi:hypothetical protein